ncbi:MAG TPA: hypothetical protein VM077_03375 [Candidatus Limnocylindrales bacterium]|nr:hypothetical protein [Candidatus Limnocylindrales bacterium]
MRHDWYTLKSEFTAGNWITVADFLRDRDIKDNSRTRLHTKGWLDEKRQYQEDVSRRTQEKVIEKEVDIRLRQQKIAQKIQVQGLQKLQSTESDDIDTNTAFKMIVSGLEQERSALGMDGKTDIVQQNISIQPKTNLDKLIESMSYVEVLGLIAELKREKEHRVNK